MEAQLQRPITHDDPHNNAVHSVIGGESEREREEQGEKKVKETMTKHGAHEYRVSEEENDETVNVHGAPPHESGFISGTNLPKQTGEKPPGLPEDRQNASFEGRMNTPSLENDVVNPNTITVRGDSAVTGLERSDDEMDRAGVERDLTTSTAPKIGPLVEDPHSPGDSLPLSNYETKEVDPTGQGGKEAEVASLIDRLDHLQSESYTGSHEQFAPTSTMPKSFASKLGYGSQEPSGRSASETVIEKVAGGGSGGNEDDTVVKETDKGVVSVRDYLAERLSPGEEDKALSEAITDAIHKRKQGQGAGVVDRVKDAVGSWLGMAPHSQGSEEVSRQGSG